MSPGADPETTWLSDPRQLRAYAHPLRMALVGLLRREGSLTATRAAALLNESVANCSFHLRQLAKHGLVEQAGGGRGREKPWRATARYTTWPHHSGERGLDTAANELQRAVLQRYFQLASRSVDDLEAESPEWKRAVHFDDHILFATPEELTAITDVVLDAVRPFLARADHPDRRPPGARPVCLVHLGFLYESEPH